MNIGSRGVQALIGAGIFLPFILLPFFPFILLRFYPFTIFSRSSFYPFSLLQVFPFTLFILFLFFPFTPHPSPLSRLHGGLIDNIRFGMLFSDRSLHLRTRDLFMLFFPPSHGFEIPQSALPLRPHQRSS